MDDRQNEDEALAELKAELEALKARIAAGIIAAQRPANAAQPQAHPINDGEK